MPFRVAVLFLISLAGLWTAEARAADLGERFCSAVTSPFDAVPERFACPADPQDYEVARLWLDAEVLPSDQGKEGTSVLVHQSRFSRLAVRFRYADGRIVQQSVQRGDYGPHWRIGGQLEFTPPYREVPVEQVTLVLDRLEAFGVLRARILTAEDASQQLSLLAVIVGACVSLLFLGALYNALLAIGTRRAFIGWHAAWATAVLLYGVVWSHLGVVVLPAIAGSLSARLGTLFATAAVAAAMMSVLAIVGRDTAPNWLRWVAKLGAAGSVAAGLLAVYPPPGTLESLAVTTGVLTLLNLVIAALLAGWGWATGSREARDFLLVWSVSMLALGGLNIVDLGHFLLGGGPQLAILIASAVQILWLSALVTVRLSRLRSERDAARAEKSALAELAERDPLTALWNRRGFMRRAEEMLVESEGRVHLLLVDLDHFKAVNDRHGHDVGDLVLEQVAKTLEGTVNGRRAAAGRIGGEEFAVSFRGTLDEARKLAEEIRRSVAALRFGGKAPGLSVTVSIGISGTTGRFNLLALYREADQALYDSKDAGRDVVTVRAG
ncbi:hypothetical protein B5C34_01745 [Pacificimonas flava]|uniref:diguanylate cyclase n=2 Tax=Pacificimonas TaxID=1960290 RepID=A0A219B3A0_9SPHN|nr:MULTISPECIES: diguanylate cyclase [Pacificimonas]MBZ6378059.1 diguanylate cyclase [Pacificimonas aurantium]OWV32299.1 hypothetical protein B5C34_01745 [Pacificimonas flava]